MHAWGRIKRGRTSHAWLRDDDGCLLAMCGIVGAPARSVMGLIEAPARCKACQRAIASELQDRIVRASDADRSGNPGAKS